MKTPEAAGAGREQDYTEATEEEISRVVELYGEVILRNPHFGKPGHEDDPEFMTVSQATEDCPPIVTALVRLSDNPEQQRAVIDVYRVKDEE